MLTFQPDEQFARHLDATDPLAGYRDRFHLPRRPDGTPALYFGTHSLGLAPRPAGPSSNRSWTRWADLGVEAHFQGDPPWYTYQEPMRPPLAPPGRRPAGEVSS